MKVNVLNEKSIVGQINQVYSPKDHTLLIIKNKQGEEQQIIETVDFFNQYHPERGGYYVKWDNGKSAYVNNEVGDSINKPKTAKEILNNTETVIRGIKGSYLFTNEQFFRFVTQLCKEQRELCVNQLEQYNWIKDKCSYSEVLKEVENAPQPQIFEEGK